MVEVSVGTYFAFIDDCDYPRVALYTWVPHHDKYTIYAKACIGVNQYVLLHRFVLELPKQFPIVDHKDKNGLNCQRSNLRICSHSLNSASQSMRSDNRSGYRGVSYHKANHKYVANIRVEGVRKYLGSFNDPVSAALEYDKYAKQYFGDYASLNFPEA